MSIEVAADRQRPAAGMRIGLRRPANDLRIICAHSPIGGKAFASMTPQKTDVQKIRSIAERAACPCLDPRRVLSTRSGSRRSLDLSAHLRPAERLAE